MKKVCIVVNKDFVDRYTGKKHKPGEKLTVTDVRFREMKRSGDFVELDKSATARLRAAENATAEEKAADSKK